MNIAKKVSWLKDNKVIIETFSDNEVRKMLDVSKYRLMSEEKINSTLE